MADNRSLREKLEAMAGQSASPKEAAVAQAILRRLPPITAGGIETPGLVTRASVLASPDRTSPVPPAYRVQMLDGSWLTLDGDMMPWETIKHYGLKWQKVGV